MKSALIVIDMLNEYDHEDAEVLVEHVRFHVAVPCDAVAGIHLDLAEAALKMMERNMRADLARAQDCALS